MDVALPSHTCFKIRLPVGLHIGLNVHMHVWEVQ